MTYTIKGKKYTEFDIKLRCSELMQVDIHVLGIKSKTLIRNRSREEYNPCANPSDTWPIIEKIWDELHSLALCVSGSGKKYTTMWKSIMVQHKCTKLVAACILFIELNT